MKTAEAAGQASPATPATAAFGHRFEALVFDWDGTAVPDRSADATRLKDRVEALSAAAADLFIVSGTHVENVDGQLKARPDGPGRLVLCLNRGSEIYVVDRMGPQLVYRRSASEREDELLTQAAELTVRRLREHGVETEIVSRRLNRRKIDLIPLTEWADPPKARIGELVAAVEERLRGAGLQGLRDAVQIAGTAALETGLTDARVTSDAKHVEIGLTDKSDSARWILRDLWGRGVGPGLVLVAGDEFGTLGGLQGSDSLLLVPEAARATAVSVGVEPSGVPPGVTWLPGGPEVFLTLLDDQIRRRRKRCVPEIDLDPAWTFPVAGFDHESEGARETMLTLADGRFGTAGAPVDSHPATRPRVLAGGVYTPEGPQTELLSCPLWDRSGLSLAAGEDLGRILDMRTGVLAEEVTVGGLRRRVLRFCSLVRPGIVALRAEGHEALLPACPPLVAPAGRKPSQAGRSRGRPWMQVDSGAGGVAAAAAEVRTADGELRRLDRLASYVADAAGPPPPEAALASLDGADRAGFDRLLVEQRAAWAGRWSDADVRIDGDPELQRALRFALFHLMGSVAGDGEAAVGARGMSGTAYHGHVFWDADVFVLPFLAATHPPAARAMLEYRFRRLPAAREAAEALGRQGARFPWESASTGSDVTPPGARDQTGREIAIRTGLLEEHVVADVAWAARTYVDWTGDLDFAAGPGTALLAETARYWASRIRVDEDGRAHIDGVIGPDEYHEAVNDNAFTNVMARWNLREAARTAGATNEERHRWRSLAGLLVDGYDPATGIYEQFAGFSELEPLIIREIAPRRPVAADLLLGRERVRHAQVIKQADVLMLHHMVPASTARGSLVPNLDFYEPRTAHGSSLSPGVHAALLARAGRLDEALATLRTTARLDLDDLTKTTAGGLHLAAMGSLWQAVVHGFGGIRAHRRGLVLDPRLPASWGAIHIPLRHRGKRVRLRLESDAVSLEAEEPPAVRFPGTPWLRPGRGVSRFRREAEGWKEARL